MFLFPLPPLPPLPPPAWCWDPEAAVRAAVCWAVVAAALIRATERALARIFPESPEAAVPRLSRVARRDGLEAKTLVRADGRDARGIPAPLGIWLLLEEPSWEDDAPSDMSSFGSEPELGLVWAFWRSMLNGSQRKGNGNRSWISGVRGPFPLKKSGQGFEVSAGQERE